MTAPASAPDRFFIPDPQIPTLNLPSPPPPGLGRPPPPPSAGGNVSAGLGSLKDVLANEHFNILYLFAILIPFLSCILGTTSLWLYRRRMIRDARAAEARRTAAIEDPELDPTAERIIEKPAGASSYLFTLKRRPSTWDSSDMLEASTPEGSEASTSALLPTAIAPAAAAAAPARTAGSSVELTPLVPGPTPAPHANGAKDRQLPVSTGVEWMAAATSGKAHKK